jgi:hypothetical protein
MQTPGASAQNTHLAGEQTTDGAPPCRIGQDTPFLLELLAHG